MELKLASSMQVQMVFDLIAERIAWMDEKGISQWNVTNYLDVFPFTYFVEKQQAGKMYVLIEQDQLQAACILETDDDGWYDQRPAFYVHQLVSDHEIRSARVLIYKKKRCTRLHALYDVCRLRCAAAGIRRGKLLRVLAVRQIVDKHGDVGLPDASAVFGSDLHGIAVRYHVFPTVACDMVINAQLESLEQRGFPVISSADYQRDTLSYAHA